MRSHKELTVWKEAMSLTAEVYRLARALPSHELYALSDQMRRAAVSVPSNIAEGNARGSQKDFTHFLRISLGSCAELQTQIELCVLLGYATADQIQPALSQCILVTKKLRALIRSIVSTV